MTPGVQGAGGVERAVGSGRPRPAARRDAGMPMPAAEQRRTPAGVTSVPGGQAAALVGRHGRARIGGVARPEQRNGGPLTMTGWRVAGSTRTGGIVVENGIDVTSGMLTTTSVRAGRGCPR